MESPNLSALPNMTRTSLAATQGDVLSFLQCLRFDPKSMIGDHKLNRPVDFKRLTSVSLGISLESSPSASSKGKLMPSPSPEDHRRLKKSLKESGSKARERVKIFSESLSVINKLFPSIPSRKRSRSDALSNDRLRAISPNDRSVTGMGTGKMGAQSHASTSDFELEQQGGEERTKSAIPNKRTRTSMVDSRSDVRASTPARTSINFKKDRETLRLPHDSAGQGEDRFDVDSWEKSMMKKKRSRMKEDVSANSVATKSIDGYREQPRLLTNTRPRLGDTHGFRPGPGVANGVRVGKADGTSRQTGMRSSISRADLDNSTLLLDRRDHLTGSEKERVNLKAVNKTNAREDYSSGSPTSSTKMNATARTPRSGSGLVLKQSLVAQRAAAASEWELSHCTNKLPAAGGINNRKRSLSARSSSPPVAQWAGQRPQKISRTGRRTNSVSIVPHSDESPTMDTTPGVVGTERRLLVNSSQQVKLKNFSFAALSESEESFVAEMKSRGKNKKTDEMDEKVGTRIQKMSALLLSPRKNKVVSGVYHGDGRRQERMGRVFTSTRSLMPLTAEKLGNAGTAKQLRSPTLGFDKNESKAGRPPSRKLSDRKAYARPKHTTISTAADFRVGSDDGHEELAAANAVINAAQALSSSFWKQMEPYFHFVSDIDLVYLKQQINHDSDMSTPTPLSFDVDSYSLVSNGLGFSGFGKIGNKEKGGQLSPEHVSLGRTPKEIPLYQRLIAALITEEENEKLSDTGKEDVTLDIYDSGFECDGDVELETFHPWMLQSIGHSAFNGYRIDANRNCFAELDHVIPNDSVMATAETGIISKYDLAENGLPSGQAIMSGSACSENLYNNMSISERLLLEIQSVGIYPDQAPDLAQGGDEEITKDISRLDEKYHEQVSKKKGLLGKILKCASPTRELQEKEFEQKALEKLVGVAYEKYMLCWGPNAHGMKSASGKMAKQAALAFVERTLDRYREYEETRKSCFGEPLYRDMFLSGISRLTGGQPVDSITDGDSGKLHATTSGRSTEIRASDPLGLQHSPSSEVLLSANLASEDNTSIGGSWPNRVKRRELPLEDVGGGTSRTSLGAPFGIRSSFSNGAKGKRSERDREGKGSNREVLSGNGTTNIGRPASSNIKREKSKAKPQQETTQLSAASNSLLGKKEVHTKANMPAVPKSREMNASGSAKDNLDVLDDPIDLSGLQLPEMDDLGVTDDFSGQGQDIGSWLNIDDDGLQDHDFMGLEIPMDDLSDLNMMV